MATKDKNHLSPAAALTPASSDDEMETSFTSSKRTGMGVSNPLYDSGLNNTPEVSEAESTCPQIGTPESKERKQVNVR